MIIYNLMKLSNGGVVDLYTDNEDLLCTVLETYCCKDCIEEARTQEDYLVGLLSSSCGAEFMLTEMTDEQYEKLEFDLNN